MRIRHVTISNDELGDRITTVFKQLGAKAKMHNGEEILVLNTTPDVMSDKMDIAFDQLKRLGYDYKGQSMKHFWYIRDKQKELPDVSVESQGSEGFVKERHDYYIYW